MKQTQLKILHIGNIANNAFQNARLQRKFGHEADVLVFDDFNALSSPEWEEARLKRPPRNFERPDWQFCAPYRRPDWFAFGSAPIAIDYLLARQSNPAAAQRLRRLSRVEQALHADDWRGQWVRLMTWPWRRAAKDFSHAPGWGIIAKFADLVGSRKFARKLRVASRLARASESPAYRARKLGPLQDCPDSIHAVRQWWRPQLAELVRRYDVVQLYGPHAALGPLLGRVYTAYEHGTLRQTSVHPLSPAIERGFAGAAAIFVTNQDNLESARAIARNRDTVCALPHAIDETVIFAFAAARTQSRPDPKLLFWPTRHDWVTPDPGFSKGNDVGIDALIKLSNAGLDFKLKLVGWGRDLEASQLRLAPIRDRVEWVSVLPKPAMWNEMLTSIAVLDQFAVPALGATPIEAMALGRPVLTYSSPAVEADFFGAASPVLSANTVTALAEHVKTMLCEPDRAAKTGAESKNWVASYHSGRTTCKKQIELYSRLTG